MTIAAPTPPKTTEPITIPKRKCFQKLLIQLASAFFVHYLQFFSILSTLKKFFRFLLTLCPKYEIIEKTKPILEVIVYANKSYDLE